MGRFTEKINAQLVLIATVAASLLTIAVYFIELKSKGYVWTIALIVVCVALFTWLTLIGPSGRAADRRPPWRLLDFDPATVVAELNEALSLFESEYNRKAASGFKGWVNEDLERIKNRFQRMIDKYAPSGSTARKSAAKLEALAHDQISEKDRMLRYEGIVKDLRDAWQSGDYGRPRPKL